MIDNKIIVRHKINFTSMTFRVFKKLKDSNTAARRSSLNFFKTWCSRYLHFSKYFTMLTKC